MSDFAEIKYVPMTSDKKNIASAMLRRSASLLKKWAVFFHPKKFHQFRNQVMAGELNPTNLSVCSSCHNKDNKKACCNTCCGKGQVSAPGIPEDRLVEFHADLPEILIIRQPSEVFEGRTVEQAVLENFAALAKRHVREWVLRDGGTSGVTRSDYLQESYWHIIEAMYHYTREDINLTTYVWRVLRNRMINMTNQSNLLCPLTNSDLDLVCRYEKAKRKNGGTFDEIVASLGMSDKEGRYLGSILTKVVSENQIGLTETRTANETRPSNDYTGHRSGLDKERLESNNFEETERVNKVLDSANLTEFERQVFNAAMEGDRGWQAEFARTHFHPNGKPYSRTWIGMVLKEARAKVAEAYQQSEAA